MGGATCRKILISWSALDKNLKAGYLFEGNPVYEGKKRRGTDTPMHRPDKTAGSTHSSTSGLLSGEQLESPVEFHSSTQDEA